MATTSRRESKVFFSHREANAFTPDTTAMIEGRGTMAFPEPEYQFESNKNKLGTGEYGTKTEIQAIWTPFTYSCQRISEIAYFLAYFQGQRYTPVTSGSLEKHQLNASPVQDRKLDTFSMEYGTGGTGNNTVFAGAVVNEFSITLGAGGNGIVEATFGGWCNKHQIVAQAFALNAAGNMSSGQFDITAEPMMNYKCTKVWKADSANDVTANSVSFTGEDLGANPVELTQFINSVTLTGNNGMSAADMARAGGQGVVNSRDRGDRVYTVELGFRKDDDNALNTDSIIIADTQMALEVQWNGSIISGSDPYAIDIIYPVVQLQAAPEDDGSPISKTATFEVFGDSNNSACEIFVQTQVSDAYNATA